MGNEGAAGVGEPISGGVEAGVIRTGRLVLEPLAVGHADEMAEVLGDPGLHGFIGGAPAGAGELRERYARMAAGAPQPGLSWCNWVIRLRDEDRLAGTVQATVGPGPDAEIAWVVGSPWQGRGIATEAARALVDWLRQQAVTGLVAHIHPDHHASAAVATAIGLRPTDEQHDGETRWRSQP